MRIPQVQIQTTDIKMDYTTQPSVQKIKQPAATQSIEQPAATLEISTADGKLTIDQSQARRDVGMIGPIEATKNMANKASQTHMEGLARRVSEGRQLLESAGKDQKGAAIKQIAIQNHGPHRPGPYNIDFVPSIGSVKIDYQKGSVDVNFERHDPKIEHKVNKPMIDYTPGKVSGTMIQRPSVSIDVHA